MTFFKRTRWIAAAFLALSAGTAFAHTGTHVVTGFVDGVAHPLTGLDHLLAMVAVGLWAARQGGRAVWLLPASFVAALAAGGMLGLTGTPFVTIDGLVAGSVLALGLLVACGRALSLPLGVALASVFALSHGIAHGAEMPLSASPGRYGMGMLLATAGLHGIGVYAGVAMQRRTVALAGATLSIAGLGLLLHAVG